MGILRRLREHRSRRLAASLPEWKPFEDAQCGHVVQFYDGPFPTESVARFVHEGLVAGEIAILIAAPDHIRAVDQRLGDQKGRVIYLDADETLAKVMVDGRPSRLKFMDTVGDLIGQAGKAGNGRVRAFGEMVVLLCERGEPEAAHDLEELWNEIGRSHSLKLLCSYPMSAVSGRNRSYQTQLRDSHTHSHGAVA